MASILSIADLRTLVNVSAHKKDEILTASIEEVENNFVKKYFGDSFYVFILENKDNSPVDGLVDLILDGGIYENAESPVKKFHLNGLNKVIANLVYADLLVKQTEVTRFGAVNKTDQYSTKPDFDNVLEQINRYRNPALDYMKQIDYMLINIDETDYSQTAQDFILEYRDENNETIKQIFPF